MWERESGNVYPISSESEVKTFYPFYYYSDSFLKITPRSVPHRVFPTIKSKISISTWGEIFDRESTDQFSVEVSFRVSWFVDKKSVWHTSRWVDFGGHLGPFFQGFYTVSSDSTGLFLGETLLSKSIETRPSRSPEIFLFILLKEGLYFNKIKEIRVKDRGEDPDDKPPRYP